MADILGQIANPNIADVAGAVDYRQKKIDEDVARRKDLLTNKLAGQALSSGLKDGTPMAELAKANPQAYITVAKHMGIDPADGDGVHQMTVDVHTINNLAQNDPQQAIAYMQSEKERRSQLGMPTKYIDDALAHVQQNAPEFFRSLKVMDQTWNPTPRKDLVNVAEGAIVVDPITGKTVASNPKTHELTPFEQAQVDHWKKADSASTGNGGLSDDAIELATDRLLNGEKAKDVLANFGRGAQGAAAITAVQNRLAAKAKEQGIDANNILQGIQNVTADNRTFTELGAREGKVATAAQEAKNFASIALDASDKVPRDKFVPWNKLKMYSESQLSDPNLAAFKAANTSLINAYARAVSGGSITVHGQEEGEKMLNTATSPESYKAVVNQILTETQAALNSPRQVREHMHAPKESTTPAATDSGGWGIRPVK